MAAAQASASPGRRHRRGTRAPGVLEQGSKVPLRCEAILPGHDENTRSSAGRYLLCAKSYQSGCKAGLILVPKVEKKKLKQ